MTIKIASIMVIAIMLLAGAFMYLPISTNAMPTEEEPTVGEVDHTPTAIMLSQEYMDGLTIDGLISDAGVATGAMVATVPDAIGTTKNYTSYDFYNDVNYNEVIEKVGEGVHCEIWVATDLLFPGGDSRNAYTSRLTITSDQVNYTIDEFDNNIYANMSSFFGVPGARNGSESNVAAIEDLGSDYFNSTDGSKVMIVISNIRDEYYHDELMNPAYYVAGYYWSLVDDCYDRNIINIDCYDWENLTGVQAIEENSYHYEAVLAHEYEHLIHDWYDPEEETFVDEGCAEYAQLVCGYGVTSLASHIGSFLQNPSNSLTIWDDGDPLSDYGAAALFVIYMNDKFGGALTIKALVMNNMTGVDGITDTLHDRGYADHDFNTVFKLWRITNLIDGNQPGNGIYKYDTLNLADVGAMYTIECLMGDYVQEGLDAYGTDYIMTERGYMRTRERLNTYAQFQGESYLGELTFTGWTTAYDSELGRDVSWSGTSYYYYTSIMQGTVDLTNTVTDEHMLTIYTRWAMESHYDCGYVQVSTDGGYSWASLSNDHTVSYTYSGEPGITDSNPWESVSWDLSAYDGQIIQVRFLYQTDYSVESPGWFIDTIELSSLEPVQADWMVTVVLYHNYRPIGVVDLPYRLFDQEEVGVSAAMPFIEYDGYAEYRAFKLRAVTSICALISPTDGPAGYEYRVVNYNRR